MRFVDIVVVLRLDLGQISLQLALLATSIAFYDILARACAEIKILRRESYLRLFVLILFPAFPFSFLFAAVIDLLLGLLAVNKLVRKRHRLRRAMFTME